VKLAMALGRLLFTVLLGFGYLLLGARSFLDFCIHCVHERGKRILQRQVGKKTIKGRLFLFNNYTMAAKCT